MFKTNSINTEVPIQPVDGGTGVATLPANGMVIGQGLNPVSSVVLTNDQVPLGSTGNDPVPSTLISGANINIDTTIPGQITISSTGAPGLVTPAFGGTGVVNPTANGIAIAEGASNFNFLPLATDQVLWGVTGNDPTARTILAGSNINIDTTIPGQVTFSANASAPANNIYVATNGSNITGNGSINNPYQTIEFALSTIVTASFTNPFVINIGSGTFNETNILFKANVSFQGSGIFSSKVIVLNPVLFDVTTFDNVQSNILIKDLNMDAVAGYNLDLTTALGLNNTKIGFETSEVTGVSNFFSRPSFQDQLACVFGVFNSDINVSSAQYVFIDALCLTNVTLTECDNFLFGGIVSGNLTVIGAVNPSNIILSTTNPPGTITLNGNFVTASISVQSYKIPILIGTPTITLINIGDGISANFIPTNYTPVDSSVTGHLKGIDAELSVSSLFPYTEVSTPTLMVPNNGYIANDVGAVTFTLPAVMAQGEIIEVIGKGTGGWVVDQQAGQVCYFNSVTSTVGLTGGISNSNQRDCIRILCITANTEFQIISAVGSTINLF